MVSINKMPNPAQLVLSYFINNIEKADLNQILRSNTLMNQDSLSNPINQSPVHS